jgi:hypothetical protein
MANAYKKDAGQKNHMRGRVLDSQDRTRFLSPRKEALNNVIRHFSSGQMNASEFREKLGVHEIAIDPTLSKLIKQQDSGVDVKFSQFGRQIFKQVERVDGID